MLFLQAAPAVNPPVSATESLTLLDLLFKGGVVMIPIGILSIIAIYLIIERIIFISSQTKSDPQLLIHLRDQITQGNIKSAEMYCSNQSNAIARVLGVGVSKFGKKLPEEIDETLSTVSHIEVMKLEKNTGILVIIAGIAPMLGFIGTISGIIRIFYNISVTDNISIGIISGGLYEKMITSGAGLIVGVVAYTGFHIINIMIDRFVLKLESSVFEFSEIINQEAK